MCSSDHIYSYACLWLIIKAFDALQFTDFALVLQEVITPCRQQYRVTVKSQVTHTVKNSYNGTY